MFGILPTVVGSQRNRHSISLPINIYLKSLLFLVMSVIEKMSAFYPSSLFTTSTKGSVIMTNRSLITIHQSFITPYTDESKPCDTHEALNHQSMPKLRLADFVNRPMLLRLNFPNNGQSRRPFIKVLI